MPMDVFLSYSHSDQALAQDVCKALGSQGIRCWLASRDLPQARMASAKSLSQVIGDKICECQTLMLVLSDRTSSSPQVIREVESASAIGKRIVVLRCWPTEARGTLSHLLEGSSEVEYRGSNLRQATSELLRAIHPAEANALRPAKDQIRQTRRAPFPRALHLFMTTAVLGISLLVWLVVSRQRRDADADRSPPARAAAEIKDPAEVVG